MPEEECRLVAHTRALSSICHVCSRSSLFSLCVLPCQSLSLLSHKPHTHTHSLEHEHEHTHTRTTREVLSLRILSKGSRPSQDLSCAVEARGFDTSRLKHTASGVSVSVCLCQGVLCVCVQSVVCLCACDCLCVCSREVSVSVCLCKECCVCCVCVCVCKVSRSVSMCNQL